MKDYYSILGISKDANNEKISEGYKNKISQFNKLPFHTKKMIEDIKSLKEARYVLMDNIKRIKYNIKYDKYKNYNNEEIVLDNTKICDRLFSITFDK